MIISDSIKYRETILQKVGTHKIATELISHIMGSLKRNKKAGYSGVRNEMLKVAKDTTLANNIAALFQFMINKCVVPNRLNIGLLVTIIKNITGSNTDIDNSRPITISESLSNIFEAVIENELEKSENAKLHICQYGFRKFSSCAHAIFTFKEACAYAKQNGIKLFIFFLDYSKAFDKVNRIKLFYTLMNLLPPHYWLALLNYYKTSKVRLVLGDGKLSDEIESTVGVKQGGKLSPRLFNHTIDKLIRSLAQSSLILKINDTPVGVIAYADDTTIMCTSKANSRLALRLISDYCRLFDIAINARKTQWMSIGSLSKGSFILNGNILEKVKTFKLLGVIVTSNLSHKQHLSKRKSLCYMGVKELEDLGFNYARTTPKMKGLLYNSICRSKLLYGIESIQLSNSELKKFETYEGNILKRANDLSTRSRSTALVYGMGISKLSVAILKRRLNFVIQVLTNEITNEIISGTRCYTLEKLFYDLGYEYENTTRVANTRDIYMLCKTKLVEIDNIEKELFEHDLTKCVVHLLSNRNNINDDTLQFLLDPRREWDIG
jgi:hypothetical protein